MAQDMLAIGEVAERAGVRPSTIRYYESIGLLPPPARVNGRRRYDTAVLERLRIVRIAQDVGFTLDEIQDLFRNDTGATPFSARWQPLAQQKLVELSALIARAQLMQQILDESLRCGCMSLEECVIFVRQAQDARDQAANRTPISPHMGAYLGQQYPTPPG